MTKLYFNNVFQVVKEFPLKKDVMERMEAIRESFANSPIEKIELQILETYGPQISNFLRGDELPLAWLYPQNDTGPEYPSAERIYLECKVSKL